MKICDGPVLYDPTNGTIVCADNGMVLATNLPASLFGEEEKSPAREKERIEEYEIRIERIEHRSRRSSSYLRIEKLLKKYNGNTNVSSEELRILVKVIKGEMTTWDAAKQLNVSPKTVYNRVKKILDELDRLLYIVLTGCNINL